MLGKVVVFLGHEHSFTEEILVDLLTISFWDKPEDIGQCEQLWGLDQAHTLSRVPGAIRGIAYNEADDLVTLFVKSRDQGVRGHRMYLDFTAAALCDFHQRSLI
jgi:hypothetical protein